MEDIEWDVVCHFCALLALYAHLHSVACPRLQRAPSPNLLSARSGGGIWKAEVPEQSSGWNCARLVQSGNVCSCFSCKRAKTDKGAHLRTRLNAPPNHHLDSLTGVWKHGAAHGAVKRVTLKKKVRLTSQRSSEPVLTRSSRVAYAAQSAAWIARVDTFNEQTRVSRFS